MSDTKNEELMAGEWDSMLSEGTEESQEVFVKPNIEYQLSKEKRQIKKGSIPKCSRKCNGEYVRKMQLGRL